MLVIEDKYGESVEQILHREYYQKRRNYREIADLLGVSEPTICQWLERFGFMAKRWTLSTTAHHSFSNNAGFRLSREPVFAG